MTDAALLAGSSVLSAMLGAFGKIGFDRIRRAEPIAQLPSVQQAIADRAEVEFQTKMNIAVESISRAIERGQEKFLDRMEAMTAAVTAVASAATASAAAATAAAESIQAHRDASAPAIGASLETAKLVRDIHHVVMAR